MTSPEHIESYTERCRSLIKEFLIETCRYIEECSDLEIREILSSEVIVSRTLDVKKIKNGDSVKYSPLELHLMALIEDKWYDSLEDMMETREYIHKKSKNNR